MGFTKRTPTQRSKDRERRAAARTRIRNRLREQALLKSFLSLGLCDEALSRAELTFLSQLGFDATKFTALQNPKTKRTTQSAYLPRPLLVWLTSASPSISERRRVLRSLQEFALCDGPLTLEEDLVLAEISNLFRLNVKSRGTSHRNRRDSAQSQDESGNKTNRSRRTETIKNSSDVPWCYEILGCSPSDTDEAIKRNYRELALKLHPDKHHAQPDLAALHVRSFQRINQAYAEIKRLRAHDRSLDKSTHRKR